MTLVVLCRPTRLASDEVPRSLLENLGQTDTLSLKDDRTTDFRPGGLGLAFGSKSRLEAENASLRHQLIVFRRGGSLPGKGSLGG
jgi:hypothetical protein